MTTPTIALAVAACLSLSACDIWSEHLTVSDHKTDVQSQLRFLAKCRSVGFTPQQCSFFQEGDEYQEPTP